MTAVILYIRFGRPGEFGDHGEPPDPEEPDHQDLFRRLLGMTGDITPRVQALPPDAALADVTGSTRYFGRDATELAALLRMRAAAHLDTDCAIGIARNPLLARLAADHPESNGIHTAPDSPEQLAAFLAELPVAALPGVTPATVRTLASYGLTTLGPVAGTAPATLQRILGATLGRHIHRQATGTDPTPVTPGAPPRHLRAEHHFSHDTLDPGLQRRALSRLAEDLGARLRGDHQTCRALTLTIRYADRSTTTRRRTLPEPTDHSPQLRTASYNLHTRLGLQRARVRRITLQADDLLDAGSATRQLTLDPGDDKARRIEATADRVRERFGPTAIHPASAAELP